jgi:hypothetical protein
LAFAFNTPSAQQTSARHPRKFGAGQATRRHKFWSKLPFVSLSFVFASNAAPARQARQQRLVPTGTGS